MGFFPNIFKKPANIFKKPVRTLAAVSTFGQSEIFRALPEKVKTPIILGAGAAASVVSLNPTPLTLAIAASKVVGTKPQQPEGVQPMALNIGGILQQTGSILGAGQNQLFQTGSAIANLAAQFFPGTSAAIVQPRPMPIPRPGFTGTGTRAASAGVMAGMAAVGRKFFNRFPNLALAIQGFRNMGQNVSRAKLWSLMKRFGPEFMITSGILTAAAVSELMVAGPGHRRMNPGNASALRRSLRRLESFHKLCVRADKFRGRGARGRKSSKSSGSTQFVRQG